jgi:hypothetical protein
MSRYIFEFSVKYTKYSSHTASQHENNNPIRTPTYTPKFTTAHSQAYSPPYTHQTLLSHHPVYASQLVNNPSVYSPTYMHNLYPVLNHITLRMHSCLYPCRYIPARTCACTRICTPICILHLYSAIHIHSQYAIHSSLHPMPIHSRTASFDIFAAHECLSPRPSTWKACVVAMHINLHCRATFVTVFVATAVD